MLLAKCPLRKSPAKKPSKLRKKHIKPRIRYEQRSDLTVSVPFQHSGEDAFLLAKRLFRNLPRISLTRLAKDYLHYKNTSDLTVSVPFQHSGEDALLLSKRLLKKTPANRPNTVGKKTYLVQKNVEFDGFGTFSTFRRGCVAPREAPRAKPSPNKLNTAGKKTIYTTKTSNLTVSVPFQHSGEDALLLAERGIQRLPQRPVPLHLQRESALNLCRGTVNLRHPERARNEGSIGPKRLDPYFGKSHPRPWLCLGLFEHTNLGCPALFPPQS